MKRIHSIIIVTVFGVVAISLATADLFLNREVNGSPLITAKVQAATLTYKRTLILSPLKTGVPSQPVTKTPIATVTPIGLINSISATPSGFIIPTSIASASATPTIGEVQLTNTIPSPTPIVNLSPTLPSSGWTQVASIMFITSSIVIFMSFLF